MQGELTRALSLIEGREVNVQGSGRTDAGVHAEGQVANVAMERGISRPKVAWRERETLLKMSECWR